MSKQAYYFMYIADPMCSWCWGFAPTLDKILDTFPLNLRIVVGGLRPGPAAQRLDDAMRSYLKTHWKHVQEASGQSFNMAGLERENWLYDTEPAARAVLTMRQISAASEYKFFKALQKAFYQDALDLTESSCYEALLEPYRIDAQLFIKTMDSDEIRQQTYQDFGLARHLGVQGFPSLLLGKGSELTMLSRGYQSFERLEPLIKQQLSSV